MTFQQITWAIGDAALLAAESAVDAFGSAPNAEFPSAEMAWQFLNDSVYGEVAHPAGLPDFMTRQFEHDYNRHVRCLMVERRP